MNVVLDASVTLAWYFEDETSPLAQSLLERVDSINFVVPSLWLLEISNRLRVALRRGRIKDEKYYAYLQHAKTLNCDIDAGRWPQDIESINQLTIKYNLSPYDACICIWHKRVRLLWQPWTMTCIWPLKKPK